MSCIILIGASIGLVVHKGMDVYDEADAELMCRWKETNGLPFIQPLIAGSRLRYKLWKRTSPSFRSAALGILLVFSVKVSSGMMTSLGLLARWTDVYVEAVMMFSFWREPISSSSYQLR